MQLTKSVVSLRYDTVEQPFFRPATYALSKSLPFSWIGVHYDYFKGYNFLSVGGELEKLYYLTIFN